MTETDRISTVPWTAYPVPTEFLVVEGTGAEAFSRGNIRCSYDPRGVSLPPDIVAARSRIEEEQRNRRQEGQPSFWNGALFGIRGYSQEPARGHGPRTLELMLYPSDYFTFLAATESLDRHLGTALRGKGSRLKNRLRKSGDRLLVPWMATSLGVMLTVVTSDDFLVLSRRRKGLKLFPGFYNGSVSEAMDRELDWCGPGAPDPYKTAVRGAEEELGIAMEPSDVVLLSFGMDPVWHQWGLGGAARVKNSADDIRRAQSCGTGDGSYENQSYHFVPFTVKHVMDFVGARGPWVPGGLVAIYQALIFFHGREALARELERRLPHSRGGFRQ